MPLVSSFFGITLKLTDVLETTNNSNLEKHNLETVSIDNVDLTYSETGN